MVLCVEKSNDPHLSLKHTALWERHVCICLTAWLISPLRGQSHPMQLCQKLAFHSTSCWTPFIGFTSEQGENRHDWTKSRLDKSNGLTLFAWILSTEWHQFTLVSFIMSLLCGGNVVSPLTSVTTSYASKHGIQSKESKS